MVEAKAGLPQLDLSFYPGQLFWLVLSFGLLYLLMSKLALPKVENTLVKRHQVLSDDRKAAVTATEEAKIMAASYEKALSDARQQARQTLAEITAAAQQEANLHQTNLQQELKQRLATAERNITAARTEALQKGQAASGELAQAILEKVTGKSDTAQVM